MRSRLLCMLLVCLIVPASGITAQPIGPPIRHVLVGSTFDGGFGIGVKSSGNKTDWLSKKEGWFEARYPAGQSWGAIFVSVGSLEASARSSIDYTPYDYLLVDIRGLSGPDTVQLGIKTDTQPDDGSEAKVFVAVQEEWNTYAVPLTAFHGTDLRKIYIPLEIVFSGPDPISLQFKDVRYLRGEPPATATGPVLDGGPRVLTFLDGSTLYYGADMGIYSSSGYTNWLSRGDAWFEAQYPAGLSSGAVFLTIGKPKDPPRPFIDLSSYDSLQVELRSTEDSCKVEVGIKTNTQPDDGSEKKVPRPLTRDWRTYSLPLSAFEGTDPARTYVVLEIAFSGMDPIGMQFRKVSYVRSAVGGAAR